MMMDCQTMMSMMGTYGVGSYFWWGMAMLFSFALVSFIFALIFWAVYVWIVPKKKQ